MKVLIVKYWLEFIFGGIITLLGLAYRRLAEDIKAQKKKETAIELGIRALLRDRILQAYNHYMDKGFCPIYAIENVNELYEQYQTLGGNGTITKLVENLRDLPIKENSNK